MGDHVPRLASCPCKAAGRIRFPYSPLFLYLCKMKIPNKYIDSLLSENMDDFDMAIHLLLNVEKFNIEKLKSAIEDLYKKNKIYKYLVIRDNGFSRNNTGLYSQLDSSYKHTYSIDDFSLDTIKETIQRMDTSWYQHQITSTPLYVIDPTRIIKLDATKNKFEFPVPNLVE